MLSRPGPAAAVHHPSQKASGLLIPMVHPAAVWGDLLFLRLFITRCCCHQMLRPQLQQAPAEPCPVVAHVPGTWQLHSVYSDTNPIEYMALFLLFTDFCWFLLWNSCDTPQTPSLRVSAVTSCSMHVHASVCTNHSFIFVYHLTAPAA